MLQFGRNQLPFDGNQMAKLYQRCYSVAILVETKWEHCNTVRTKLQHCRNVATVLPFDRNLMACNIVGTLLPNANVAIFASNVLYLYSFFWLRLWLTIIPSTIRTKLAFVSPEYIRVITRTGSVRVARTRVVTRWDVVVTVKDH